MGPRGDARGVLRSPEGPQQGEDHRRNRRGTGAGAGTDSSDPPWTPWLQSTASSASSAVSSMSSRVSSAGPSARSQATVAKDKPSIKASKSLFTAVSSPSEGCSCTSNHLPHIALRRLEVIRAWQQKGGRSGAMATAIFQIIPNRGQAEPNHERARGPVLGVSSALQSPPLNFLLERLSQLGHPLGVGLQHAVMLGLRHPARYRLRASFAVQGHEDDHADGHPS